jgi:RNA polymerase sigma-70 factor (ECF subfamily)
MVVSQKKQVHLQQLLTIAEAAYRKKLNSYALYRCNNLETSEDLVQQTFMKTWLYLVKGGKIEVMRAFLYHVLNDLIVDEYRKHKTISLDVLCGKGYVPSFDDSKRFLNSLDAKAATLLIERLPEKYRNVVRMRYLEDLSLEEISLATKKSKNSIAVQVNRGIARLKLLYKFM